MAKRKLVANPPQLYGFTKQIIYNERKSCRLALASERQMNLDSRRRVTGLSRVLNVEAGTFGPR